MLYLRTLGHLSLHQGGPDGPALIAHSKAIALCAVLAVRPDYSASRDYLAELLWPEMEHSKARRALRQALHYLTTRAGTPVIRGDDTTLTLDVNGLTVDLHEFERALQAGDDRRVVELYVGHFLPGLEGTGSRELEEWIESQDEYLRAGLEVAYSRLVNRSIEAGDMRSAADYARRYVDLNPLNEAAQVALVRSLKATGDAVGALQAYRSYRALLKRVVDGRPSEDLERLAAAVREELVSRPPELPRESRRATWSASPVWRWAVGGGTVGALVGAVVASLVLVAAYRADRRDAGILAGLTGELYLQLTARGPEQLAKMTYRDGDVDVEPLGWPAYGVVSPDGRHLAFNLPARDGYNLVVRETKTGADRVLTTEPLDETPCGWSPDGRYLLYRQGELMAGARDYNTRLMVYDMATGERRSLGDVRASRNLAAVWSPDGTRVAFGGDPAGNEEVFVVALDGTELVNISRHPAPDDSPAWSPDGRYLAFVSERSGPSDIYIVSADGTDLRPVTRTGTVEVSPRWLSDSVLGFVVEGPDGTRDAWALNVISGQRQQLTERGDVWRIAPGGNQGSSWINEITVGPATDCLVSPGQLLQLELGLADAEGRLRRSEALPIRWSVSDTSVAELLAPGLLKVRGLGDAEVVASAGGWIADTLALVARPLVEQQPPLLFAEDWTRGLDSARWVSFGEPPPYTRALGGPEGGGYFVANGDASFPSGAVSRQAFAAAAGLTLEFWASLPFTDQLYQDFAAWFSSSAPAAAGAEWRGYEDSLIVALRYAGGSGVVDGRCEIWVGSDRHVLPLTTELGDWHRYAVQLAPDGTVSVIVDGRLLWQSTEAIPSEGLGSLHIALGERSASTRLAHGPLRLFAGVRYRLR